MSWSAHRDRCHMPSVWSGWVETWGYLVISSGKQGSRAFSVEGPYLSCGQFRETGVTYLVGGNLGWKDKGWVMSALRNREHIPCEWSAWAEGQG